MRRSALLSIIAIGAVSAAASMPQAPVTALIEPGKAPKGGRAGAQPHGHSSSQGSTSNNYSRAERKRRKKLAKKGRRNSR